MTHDIKYYNTAIWPLRTPTQVILHANNLNSRVIFQHNQRYIDSDTTKQIGYITLNIPKVNTIHIH